MTEPTYGIDLGDNDDHDHAQYEEREHSHLVSTPHAHLLGSDFVRAPAGITGIAPTTIGSFVIPADVEDGEVFRGRAWGQVVNATGSNQIPAFRFQIDGVTYMQDTINFIGTSPNNRRWSLGFKLAIRDGEHGLTMGIFVTTSIATATSLLARNHEVVGARTIPLTTEQLVGKTVALTLTNSVNSASMHHTPHAFYVERLT